MDIYHVSVVSRGRDYHEDRHSLEAAKSWAAEKLAELGKGDGGVKYERSGDALVAEINGTKVTISPR